MITHKKVQSMTPGDVLTDTIDVDTKEGYRYSRRIRNYAYNYKDETRNFSVSVKDGEMTISCYKPVDLKTMSDKLRALQPGEIIHPAPSGKYNNIWSIANSLEGSYKVSLVVQVERLK